jgi:hypothetical protein
MAVGLHRAQSRAQQVEVCPIMRLLFDQLELGDLTFGLSVGPRLSDRRGGGAWSTQLRHAGYQHTRPA